MIPRWAEKGKVSRRLNDDLQLILATPGSVGVAFDPVLPEEEDAPAAGAGPACCDTMEVRPAGLAPFI